MRKTKMTFVRYLFSDKGSAITWISVLIGILIFTGIYYIMRISVPENYDENYRSIFGLIILGIYIVIFIGFYLMSYVNYILQFRFKEKYSKIINKIHTVRVEIHQDSFTIKPFRQNYDAVINVKPKLDSFELILIDDFEFLIGQVSEMGIFRYHLRPILIKKGKADLNDFSWIVSPKIKDIEPLLNDIVIKFKRSYKGINTLILKEYPLSSATNNAYSK